MWMAALLISRLIQEQTLQSSHSRCTQARWDAPLKYSQKCLRGAAGTQLTVVGKFQAIIKSKDRSSKQIVYVVKGLKHPLLGRPSIQALNVLPHIDSVTEESEFITKYPTVFSGLGQYGTEYQIEIKPNTSPWGP